MVQSCSNVLFDCTSAAFSRSAHPTNKAKAKNAWFDNECAVASNNFKQVRNQFCATNLIRTEVILFQWEPGTTKLKRLKRKNKSKKKAGRFLHWQKNNHNFLGKPSKKKLYEKNTTVWKITITDLFDHFKSIYGEDENSTGQEDRALHVNPEQVVNEEVDAEISLTEIKMQFCWKNNKSTGTDQIYAEMFYSNCITDCF